MSANEENHTKGGGTIDSCGTTWHFATDVYLVVIFSFICVACILGLVGNATVIGLLGFCMKRAHFIVYILNLAIADFGVLISTCVSAALFNLKYSFKGLLPYFRASVVLSHIMFSISQLLLTVISVDRCVSVLFPVWYRFHRPEKLSAVLCAVIWIYSFLVHGILIALHMFRVLEGTHFYAVLVNAVVCLPLITISTMILFIKFCFKPQLHQRKKFLMAILLALFFFFFLAFPLNVIELMHHFPRDGCLPKYVYNFNVGYLCASLNSCVNPLIYFLIGRKKRGLCRENLRLVLQRVFKDVSQEEPESSVQFQVSAQLHQTA